MATDKPDHSLTIRIGPVVGDSPDHTHNVEVSGGGGGALSVSKLTMSVAKVVPHATWTLIDVWDDTAPGFDEIGAFAAANPDRYTIPSAGTYLLAYWLETDSTGDYSCLAHVTINSTDPANDGEMPFSHHALTAITNWSKILANSEAFQLAANDVIRVYVQQRAGVDKGISRGRFSLVKLS